MSAYCLYKRVDDLFSSVTAAVLTDFSQLYQLPRLGASTRSTNGEQLRFNVSLEMSQNPFNISVFLLVIKLS